MTPALVLATVATVATIAALWPQLRGAFRRAPAEPLTSPTAFVAFALWTIHGDLTGRPALVAVSAICLVVTALALSARSLFGAPTRLRASRT